MEECVLRVKLTADECRDVDRACIRESSRRGVMVNRSDLVRLWIAAGCTLAGEQLTGPKQSPKPASADSAAAPVVAGSEAGAVVSEFRPPAGGYPPGKKPSSSQPAADASAGAAPARLPIEKPKGGVL